MGFDIEFKPASDFRKEMLDVLNDLQQSLQAAFEANGSTTKAEIIRGFVTNYGQEYRLQIRSESSKIPHDYVLLRVHIPRDPIARMDAEGELTEISSAEELRTELNAFISKPETQELITEMKDEGL